MIELKVTNVGSLVGVILCEEALQMLGVQNGDTLYLSSAPDGSCRLSRYKPGFAEHVRAFEEVLHEGGEILRALAK
jgi:putative addiction module antidote